jgi:hypothetical protein
LKILYLTIGNKFYSGGYKYNTRVGDERIARVLGTSGYRNELIGAAYADSTWSKINSALNTFENFASARKIVVSWPLDVAVVSEFISWATFSKDLSPNTITSYLSHLKLIHKLRGLDCSGVSNFICKTQIRGAQNLAFYADSQYGNKKVMTLPLLQILGHQIASKDWSAHSKIVIWSAFNVAFFGSFRFGEIVAPSEHSFNRHETLLWSDVKFFDDGSICIHNKIPKTRIEKGEFISLFEFPDSNCCPVQSLKCLKNMSNIKGSEHTPVFTFSNGKFLTGKKANKLLSHFLEPYLGAETAFYSCKSFRAALPSALSSYPLLEDENFIKRWGRWSSNAYERYTRLNHKAKKEIFVHFAEALSRT